MHFLKYLLVFQGDSRVVKLNHTGYDLLMDYVKPRLQSVTNISDGISIPFSLVKSNSVYCMKD